VRNCCGEKRSPEDIYKNNRMQGAYRMKLKQYALKSRQFLLYSYRSHFLLHKIMQFENIPQKVYFTICFDCKTELKKIVTTIGMRIGDTGVWFRTEIR